jgi:riboflavin synthase
MFTGIIQSFAFIQNIDLKNNIYNMKTNLDLNDCQIGSSICCDGVCLTITNILNDSFSVNIGEETIKKTNIFSWNKNIKINLEKSLKVGDEISGHFVYGHVDTTIELKKITKLQNSWEYKFSLLSFAGDVDVKKFLAEKGSVAINGISLTVANLSEKYFNISVIPHTFMNTNLSTLKENDRVNIEFDPLARYIVKAYNKAL